MNTACNILVVGQTGVGKSSLVNYLVGSPVAPVGVGRPQTGRDDVPSYKASFGSVKMKLFDSWGIEADKVEDWTNRIEKIIRPGQGEPYVIGAVWFHAVIYCISCGNSRVQENDCQMIRFFQTQGFSVVVALTKADQATDSDQKALLQSLNNHCQSVFISSGGNLRSGHTDPFGKMELLAALISESVQNLPERQRIFALGLVRKWNEETLRSLNQKEVSRIANKELEDWIHLRAKELSFSLSSKTSTFIQNELLMFSHLGSYSTGTIDCSLQAARGNDLSVGETVSCVLLSPFLLIPAILDIVFNGEKQEREKIESLIHQYEKHFRKHIEHEKEVLKRSLKNNAALSYESHLITETL